MSQEKTLDIFIEFSKRLVNPRVLEIGTKRSGAESTMRGKQWVPTAREILGTDIEFGQDVDFISDNHNLWRDCVDQGIIKNSDELFDVVISRSVFEHLERPWIAAIETGKVLRSGGFVFVQTHQSFPIHAYPEDYFRFSDKALEILFKDAGFEIISSGYSFPCKITPLCHVPEWNNAAESFLNSSIFAIKI